MRARALLDCWFLCVVSVNAVVAAAVAAAVVVLPPSPPLLLPPPLVSVAIVMCDVVFRNIKTAIHGDAIRQMRIFADTSESFQCQVGIFAV